VGLTNLTGAFTPKLTVSCRPALDPA